MNSYIAKKEIIEIKIPIQLAGVSTTINSADQDHANPNSGLNQLMAKYESILRFIPKKEQIPKRYSIYTDCQLKWFGLKGADIKCFVGIETSQLAAISTKEVEKLQIPKGQYFVRFVSKKGDVSEILPKMREEIMKLTPEELGGTMTIDYQMEVYDPKQMKIAKIKDENNHNTKGIMGVVEFWTSININK